MIKGFTLGAFDFVHAGHVLMFKEAKKHCDWLIIGLHDDPSFERPQKHKPIMSVEERMIMLKGCRYVDEVFVYHTEQDSLDWMLKNKDEVKLKFNGDDWKDRWFTGKDLFEVIYVDRSHGYSSTNVRERIKNET